MNDSFSSIFPAKRKMKLFNVNGWFEEETDKLIEKMIDEKKLERNDNGEVVKLLIIVNMELMRALMLLINLITMLLQANSNKKSKEFEERICFLTREVEELRKELVTIIKEKEDGSRVIGKLLNLLKKVGKLIGIGFDISRVLTMPLWVKALIG